MKLKLWQVDAFADRVFTGNPAAVVPLQSWLPDSVMQAIAAENNLAETAFFVPRGDVHFHLRWFTPTVEVELCGHATLASGWVVLEELQTSLRDVQFETRSGVLQVQRGENGRLLMRLPAYGLEPHRMSDELARALGEHAPDELLLGRSLVAVWNDPDVVRNATLGDLAPLIEAGGGRLIVTAGGERAAPYDIVSRFFAPGYGIPEDPVTGSAHSTLVPFWAKRLGKKTLRAWQASARGGELLCKDEGDRVLFSGSCVLYLRGEIEV